MSKKLIIVESPAKAKTIGKFLGRGYTVKASMGHVRDLPKSQFGVDIDNGFLPRYITVRGQGKTLQELKKAVKGASKVLLATDPDREGEAISWHLAEALGLDTSSPNRIEFNEITKNAVKAALERPRPIDDRLVNAQQARRVLDRLVGYQLSPLLWAKVKRGLSAGRVQSVALRLICDREAEIAAFVQEEYWSISATFKTDPAPVSGDRPKENSGQFEAKLWRLDGAKVDLKSGDEAQRVIDRLRTAEFVVGAVTKRERRRNPAPPFTTSTMQQEASRRLGFSARKTMSLAQQLYEGLDIGDEGTVGLITYLRTDATSVSTEAQEEARRLIDDLYGEAFRPAKPPQYKSRAGAQAAHEAIRPTSVYRKPDDLKAYLTRDQLRLYRLIWDRFVSSQMAPAILDTVTVDVDVKGETFTKTTQFRATGSTVKFPGFTIVYTEQKEEDQKEDESHTIPDLTENQRLEALDVQPHQHFTQPPPRYTEAMLVKTLEELGIGRPSTYVQIIDTIQRRAYVEMVDKRFVPTELGQIIVDILKEHFSDIVDVEFTANLEEKLDRIEEGEVEWQQVIQEFYGPFESALEQAKKEIEAVTIEDVVTDEVCEQCGRHMVIKSGRFGEFLACSGFPDCRNTKPILKEIGVNCPDCGKPIVERRSRRGRTFFGCSGYPDCSFVSWQRPVAHPCPECGGVMGERVRKGTGTRWQCQNKECAYVMDPIEESPTAEPTSNGAAGNGHVTSASVQGVKSTYPTS